MIERMSVEFLSPEPGQLEDGECYCQPFYRLWGGDDQPLVDGVFDGVGIDARAAYEDAVLNIERNLSGGEYPEQCENLLHHCYDISVHDLVSMPVGGPFLCRLMFHLTP